MSDGNKVVKAGTSKASAAVRRKLFAERYLVNGGNGKEAAIHVGSSPVAAGKQAHEWLKLPDVRSILDAGIAKVVQQAELTTERWAKEMAAIGHFDPGTLYDEDGALIPIHKLPEHVRRAIASVKHETRMEGKGPDRVAVTTQEIKLNDKNTALANIGRHLGAFDKDNAQRITAIQVNIQLLG